MLSGAEGEVGLDQYQVRRYDSWYGHVTVAMFAHAFLTVTRAAASEKGPQTQLANQLIPLTVPEIRRLLIRVETGRVSRAATWTG